LAQRGCQINPPPSAAEAVARPKSFKNSRLMAHDLSPQEPGAEDRA